MSEENTSEEYRDFQCSKCDSWIRTPETFLPTTTSCPGCGAELKIPASSPHAESGRSRGFLNALFLGLSIAAILGIYGINIYRGTTRDEAAQTSPNLIATDTDGVAPMLNAPAVAETDPTVDETGDETEPLDPLAETTGETQGPETPVVVTDEPDSTASAETTAEEPDTTASAETTAEEIDTTATAEATSEEPDNTASAETTPSETVPPETVAVVDEAPPAQDIAEVTTEEPASTQPEDDVDEVPPVAVVVVEFDEEAYLATGWKVEASEVLAAFMSAETLEERLPHVMDPERVRPLLRARYQDGSPPPTGISADDFDHVDLSEADHRKGIFLMTRDKPGEGQTDQSHRCYAFFKRTDDGLKLDWEVFHQTTDQTFRNFIESPQPGVSRVFRVFITEDPTPQDEAAKNYRAYFIADLANFNTSTRIRVTAGSPVGKILSAVDFFADDGKRRIMKNATVEMRWTDQPENPSVELAKFICWEFLGLGGEPVAE